MKLEEGMESESIETEINEWIKKATNNKASTKYVPVELFCKEQCKFVRNGKKKNRNLARIFTRR